MTREEIKDKMLQWNDFYGGNLNDDQEIREAKSDKELLEILDRHGDFMESMLSDALSHLSNFKKELGLLKEQQ